MGSTAPSGFAVINNYAYGDWNNSYLVGSLKFQCKYLTVNDEGVKEKTS
jgi:hypothetical protein